MDEGRTAELATERTRERVLAAWGLELPESAFRFWAFLESLDASGRAALLDLELSACGLSDLRPSSGASAPRPRDGIDIRVHGRYYRDPPEFLTFLHGGSDGLHHGLWSDDGRTCAGVASYHTHDGGGIDRRPRTPLEAVRETLEHFTRDLDDDEDGPENRARRARWDRLRETLAGYATGDRPETGLAYLHRYAPAVRLPADPARVTTLDGAGALVSGGTALDRPPHHAADEHRFATFMHTLFDDAASLEDAVEEARARYAAGDPAEALVLGRDLHWASHGDPVREAYAHELLTAAYGALGRPALAAIADAHHRHRGLPHVDVLERPSAGS